MYLLYAEPILYQQPKSFYALSARETPQLSITKTKVAPYVYL